MRLHQHQRGRRCGKAQAALRYDYGSVAGTGLMASATASEQGCDGGDRGVLEARLEPAGRRVRVAVSQSAASEIDPRQEDGLQRRGANRGSTAAWTAPRSFVPPRPIRELRDLTR